jgi:hypothetical protein
MRKDRLDFITPSPIRKPIALLTKSNCKRKQKISNASKNLPPTNNFFIWGADQTKPRGITDGRLAADTDEAAVFLPQFAAGG